MNDLLKIGLNPECRLLICRPVGLLSAEHVWQLLAFLLPFEDSTPEPFNRLLDLTLVTEIQFSSIVVHEYAKARREATANLRPFRTAIIAPETDAEEIAIIYATLMSGTNIQVNIFRDRSSAAKWLAVSENDLSPERTTPIPAFSAADPTAP